MSVIGYVFFDSIQRSGFFESCKNFYARGNTFYAETRDTILDTSGSLQSAYRTAISWWDWIGEYVNPLILVAYLSALVAASMFMMKDHQVLMSNNLKQEFENNLAHTFQALSLIDENKENMNYQLNEQFIPQTEEQETMMMNMNKLTMKAAVMVVNTNNLRRVMMTTTPQTTTSP